MENLRAGNRDFTTVDSSNRYSPTVLENSFKKMVSEFGVNLSKVRLNPLNGTKLVRAGNCMLSEDGQILLAAQYTRFSLWTFNQLDLVSAYYFAQYHKPPPPDFSQTKKYRKMTSRIIDEIQFDHNDRWDPFAEVTEQDYYPRIKVINWPEEIYVALYNNKARPAVNSGELLIHEPGIEDNQLGRVHDRPPFLHISYASRPAVRTRKGLEYLSHLGCGDLPPEVRGVLNISYPLIARLHRLGMRSSKLPGELDLDPQSERVAGKRFNVPSSVSEGPLMSYLSNYLQAFTEV